MPPIVASIPTVQGTYQYQGSIFMVDSRGIAHYQGASTDRSIASPLQAYQSSGITSPGNIPGNILQAEANYQQAPVIIDNQTLAIPSIPQARIDTPVITQPLPQPVTTPPPQARTTSSSLLSSGFVVVGLGFAALLLLSQKKGNKRLTH